MNVQIILESIWIESNIKSLFKAHYFVESLLWVKKKSIKPPDSRSQISR